MNTNTPILVWIVIGWCRKWYELWHPDFSFWYEFWRLSQRYELWRYECMTYARYELWVGLKPLSTYIRTRTQLLTTTVRKELGKWLTWIFSRTKCKSNSRLHVDTLTLEAFPVFKKMTTDFLLFARSIFMLPRSPLWSLKLTLGHEKNAIKGILSRRRRVAWRLSKISCWLKHPTRSIQHYFRVNTRIPRASRHLLEL